MQTNGVTNKTATGFKNARQGGSRRGTQTPKDNLNFVPRVDVNIKVCRPDRNVIVLILSKLSPTRLLSATFTQLRQE
jgi:hypothetical protein